MKAESSTISFRPLKHNRFRVIIKEEGGKKKSGSRINSGQTKRARSAHESQRLHRLQSQQPPARESVSSGRRRSTISSSSSYRSEPSLRKATMDSSGSVFCPFCFYHHSPTYFSISAGEMACGNCGEKFIVVSAEGSKAV